MKKKRGFTLVELLAVIVILAVILIIAVPKISDVIKNSKEASLETTAKLIASQAEKKYTENQVLDGSGTISCNDVSKINDADYESCNISFDSKGNAKVTIVGKGKFEGMAVCNANKNSASISSDCSTNAKYFSYEEVSDDDYGIVKTTTISSFEVEDENKCKSYLQTKIDGLTEDQATTLCAMKLVNLDGAYWTIKDFALGIPSSDYQTAGLSIENVYIIVESVEVKDENKCKSYYQTKGASEDWINSRCTTNVGLSNLKEDVVEGSIPLIDYEEVGLNVTYKPYAPSIKITGYNIEGGTDVVIPSQIDGKTVVAIGEDGFTSGGVIPTLTATNNDYKVSLLNYNSNNNFKIMPLSRSGGLGITSVVIPSTVVNIESYAFFGNKITSITFPDTQITLGCDAFAANPIMEDGSYSFPSNVTEVCE